MYHGLWTSVIVTESLRILMSGLIDYAGLFPPAALDMRTTVANWAAYRAGERAWMLGRLVVPVARLGEFEQAMLGAPPPTGPDAEIWRITALGGDTLDADIERIFRFNQRHAGEGEGPGVAVIDALELKAVTSTQIDKAMHAIPEQLEPFFEIPVTGDLRGLVAAMAGTGARAKVRTGGVTPAAFPSTVELARFLSACAAAEVPFKATAGLHHPVRGSFPLTYEPGCASATMFGFFNVFLAAAFMVTGRAEAGEVAGILEESNARAFAFDDGGVTWRDLRLDTARLSRVRESFAVSFGSCSFEEPVADLEKLGLL